MAALTSKKPWLENQPTKEPPPSSTGGGTISDSGLVESKVWARGNPLTVVFSKIMGLIFPLLLGRSSFLPRPIALALGLLGLPFLLLAGPLSFLTLPLDFGDDCIGYTVLAKKPQRSS
jgi:hypothetical protein